MYKIEDITSDAYQKHTLVLSDGTSFSITLYYMPMQYGWFIKEFIYGTFTLNGLRICNNPNMLYQFKNKVPFGLACFSKDNREPMLIDDFSSGNSVLYVLTSEEVTYYESVLKNA